MGLAAGARLGPYEILDSLGAGGMGEVYRARDTRLDRAVAIKVLPPHLASDPQLRERFDREARTISSLSHPHICALFDVGHHDGIDFLVLEYLEGETVAQRIARGSSGQPALTVAESLKIAIQICAALDKAHRAGIVHRDLKPANVMITKGGAKLLDFGLAKSAAPVVATSGLSMMPTTPPSVTAQGTILGTFQYMAPEQIEGLEADARTDIFAFGALLFEMLTGRPAFEGRTRASLLGAILKDDPPQPTSLQPLAPRALDRLVATCLAKDADDRYQSARDLLRDLEWAASDDAEAAAPATTVAQPRWRRTLLLVTATLAIALLAMTALLVWRSRAMPTPVDAIQFTIPVPDNARFGGPSGGGTGPATQLAVSPDGGHVVFVAAQRDGPYLLWLRSLSTLVATPVAGTEGASFPFWSPDSRNVGFFAGNKLKKVQITGGPPVVLCDAQDARGGTWNTDNVILFGLVISHLWRVSSAGGVPTQVTTLDTAYAETSNRWPHFLPDGRHFLFTAVTGAFGSAPNPSLIKIGSLDSAETTTLFAAESSAAYADGRLIYLRDGTLMAQPFDLAARKVMGDAFPVAEQVGTEGSRYASFSVSPTGVLAFAQNARAALSRLTWYDRAGRSLGTVGEAARYSTVALAPDERRIAVTQTGGSGSDIWVIDANRGVSSRLTFDPPSEFMPVWSPDSSRVAYQSASTNVLGGLRQKIVTGTQGDEPVVSDDHKIARAIPWDWSSDGRFLAYSVTFAGAGSNLWILPLSGDAAARQPFPIVEGPFAEEQAVFAPDGRWFAYVSDESGMMQVYVQPFPATGARYPISRNGGWQPLWRADGRELFFLARDGTLMATAVDTTRQFEAAIPQPLFMTAALVSSRRQYAVSVDGKRFLMLTPERSVTDVPITVVTNWLAAR